MKTKNIMAAFALMLALGSYAQKDELKTLKKIYEKEKPSAKDVADYKAALDKATPLATAESDKVYLNFYKANVPFTEMTAAADKPEDMMKPEFVSKYFTLDNVEAYAIACDQVLQYEKKSGKKVFTDDINEATATLKPLLLNMAVAYGKADRHQDAARLLYAVYLLDRTDTEKLFYAANYAVNAKDYDLALRYYQELKALNYSGEKTIYWAKNVANGLEETFNSKADRDNFIKLKTHTAPRDEKIPSQRGEIYKNIALILLSQNKTEEAKQAIVEARRENPNDTSLITSEADLYLKLKDFPSYERLVKEALEKNPNDATLNYNLGVISAENGKADEAEKYYKRAIEIDPKYTNAYLNMAIMKLDPEKDLVERMNKLGTSAADNKKYEVLKKQRNDMFTGAIPYLEKAVELDPSNYDAASTLLGVYSALEMTEKAKPLKERVKQMRAEGKDMQMQK
jgi:tetratricopeptide (TPR) repeat protein